MFRGGPDINRNIHCIHTFAHELFALGSQLLPLLEELGTVGADLVVRQLVQQRVEGTLEREEASWGKIKKEGGKRGSMIAPTSERQEQNPERGEGSFLGEDKKERGRGGVEACTYSQKPKTKLERERGSFPKRKGRRDMFPSWVE